MAEWITIPSVATDDVLPVDFWQDIRSNLYMLKDPMHASQSLPGPISASWDVTGGTPFADIDSTYYQLGFESSGNDILVVAGVQVEHSSLNGLTVFTLTLDGVAVGNTQGLLLQRQWYGAGGTFETRQLVYIFENVSAGSHHISVQRSNGSGGTSSVRKPPCMGIWITEL
jgi:hypothetical protein